MISTFISALFALYLFFNPLPDTITKFSGSFPIILFIAGTLTAFIAFFITLFAWSPLQQTEQNTTPGVLRAFSEDRHLKLTATLMIAFLFLTYAFAVDLLFIGTLNPTYLLIGWTIILGIAIDCLRHLIQRVMNYLDPYHVVNFFEKKAQESVRRSDFKEVCDWFDTFSDISMKALSKHNISLSLNSIDKMRSLSKDYLVQAKKIHFNDEEKKGDHINYILFYLFQRIEMIYEAALRQKLEPICSFIITILGKIAIYCAKFDISVAHYPLFYLGKLTQAAQDKELEEVGNRATLTMLEVSKVILNEVDLQYTDIKETFLTIIDNMHTIAQQTFRHDKSTSIGLLTQPFFQLKELFLKEKASTHQDTPTIIAHIDQVLNEFATLENVLNTLPPVTEMEKEKKNMEQQQESPEQEEENG